MSSMRNAVQRRNHKERAQPEERKKWGLLEKRKDYKLRAHDHKAKQARLKTLKEKASERNPDEFSFGMMSSTVDKAGRKVTDRGNKSLDMDVVNLLKTQDAGYIRTMLQMVRNEREELEKRLVLEDDEVRVLKDGDNEKKGRHTVYVGKKEEQDEFDEEEWFGKGAEMPGRGVGKEPQVEDDDDDEGTPKKHKRPSKKQQEAKALAQKQEKLFMSKRERAQQRAAAHLEAVKARERALMAAEEELEIQRAKMNHTVGGVNKNGVKFKIRERKR
ncbi:hypothetical protein PMIN06_005478 [Paraphaeosphaeria minitans]|uniref:U3 small nucleolar RNA-associated protein 11 n=1 Tax=Paraphaeosphaeria minitans TaxID=565426 RepID=A0A9P6G4N9_9PLEO|nr:hypothetical protein PMIN01_12707 [Paraphaeosphaeria minitans]